MKIFMSETDGGSIRQKVIKTSFDDFQGDDGFVFVGYPFNDVIIDAVFASKNYGVFVFIFSDIGVGDFDQNILDELADRCDDYNRLLKNRLETDRDIRKSRIKVESVIVFRNICSDDINSPGVSRDVTVIFSDEHIAQVLPEFKIHDDLIFNRILKIMSGHSALDKPKRPVPERFKGKKVDIISEIERQIGDYDFDEEQVVISRQIPPGPQRIRGLAGTGKTIVLTMKIAYMHYIHPDWNLVYTFNTQSLYDQIQSLISRFYAHFSSGGTPNFEKVKILHGWGGTTKDGLYNYLCRIVNKPARKWDDAQDFFQYTKNSELLGLCCTELISNTVLPEVFDAILVDEAQDFDRNFLVFCHRILKWPKRIVWAYDELQSLEDVSIPTAVDIFGVNEQGHPVVDLDGVYEDGIEKDFILLKSYRNPRIVLVAAHFFGMGIFRAKGPIQFIPTKEGWDDVGYKVEGELTTGKTVGIERLTQNSPNNLELFTSKENILNINKFSEKQHELDALCQSIQNDIFTEGILPEEIVVIGLTSSDLFKKYFPYIKKQLSIFGVNSKLIGVDTARDQFKVPNYVSLSTVFKAKGNEAHVVYVFNFERSESSPEILKFRNMAFTSMTRAKGWCNIFGTGKSMEAISLEFSTLMSSYPNIKFKVPDITGIKRYLDNMEYENRRKRIKKTEADFRRILKDKAIFKDLPQSIKDELIRSLKGE